MDHFFAIKLDKENGIPVYRQLGDALWEMIENGVLKQGAKLPPIRKMAEALKVNNVTVVSAYKYLEQKKVVYAHMGSGTYVSEFPTEELPRLITNIEYDAKRNLAFDVKDAINFANSSISTEFFPVDEFKKCLNAMLDRDKGNAFNYTDSQGYQPLRESIAGYLEEYGMKTDAGKIQIISGVQQGIDMIAKATLNAGDVLFIEKPTYYGAAGGFLSRGVQVIEVPMEDDGLDLIRLRSLLKLYRPKFIYTMTYFQTPTCVSYSMEKKRRLLELADEYNTYIIEEDNQSEFNYSTQPVVPLKALDNRNRVVYIKSVSKILMPGLRLGFMVLPEEILLQVMQAKYTVDISTSGFTQRAFDLYLRSGNWKPYTAMMKGIFQSRYKILTEALDTYAMEYINYNKPLGGLNIWLEMKNKEMSSNQFSDNLVKAHVIVTPGSIFSLHGQDLPYIRISFADVKEKDIEKGIQIMADVFRQMTP